MKKPIFISRRFHFVLDAFDCDLKLISDPDFLVKIMKKIAVLLDMKILKGPEMAEGIPENPGYTVFAIIDFSHISIHTFTNEKEFCLDIFSCKTFDYKKLEKFIKKTFNLNDENLFKSIVRYDQLDIERDKNDFSAEQYLKDYSSKINNENKEILSFYKNIHKKSKGKSMLALEGTPTIYQVFSASEILENINLEFCTQKNQEKAISMIIKDFNYWKKYLEISEIVSKETENKIKKIVKNSKTTDPSQLHSEYIEKFDIIQSNFCLETNTDDISEFKRTLFFINKYLKKNGAFYMVALESARAYRVGNKYFPSIYLDKELIEKHLKEASFEILNIKKIQSENSERNKYHGILLIEAKKRNKI